MIKKLFFAAVLLVCAQVAMAENVLYAQVEGTNMTLKYGEKPADSGSIKNYQFDGTAGWNGTFYGSITTVTVDASCSSYDGTTLQSLFSGFSKLTDISGIDNLNTNNVTSMRLMFNECSSLTTLDLRSMNTAKVTDMSMMFYQCSGLTSLRVCKFNTANVTDMRHMFQECSSLTTLNLSEWNTAKVTSMTSMFQGCSDLVTIYVDAGWNTDAVSTSDLMFYGCSNIKGGKGTEYSSSTMDKTYARIDEGGEKSGYMSCGSLTTNLAEGRRWATWYRGDTYVIDEDEDADAYAAEYDAANSRLILHKIGNGKIIPKYQAVIIVADKDNEYIIMNEDDDAHADMPPNDLKHRDYDWYNIDDDVYVMGMVNGKFGFHKFNKDREMPAHKAYLQIPSGSSVSAISLAFSEEVTGIKEVYVDEGQAARNKVLGDDSWYTLNGMRLSGKPNSPGLYIYNGKKTIIE